VRLIENLFSMAQRQGSIMSNRHQVSPTELHLKDTLPIAALARFGILSG